MKKHHAAQFELPGAERVFNLSGEEEVVLKSQGRNPAPEVPAKQPDLFQPLINANSH
jgi:hypothetical protein